MEPTAADLAPVRDAVQRGLYVTAHRLILPLGSPLEWKGVPGRILAGRLAVQLGAPRLGRYLHLKAYRDHGAHPEAIYYHARTRLERLGPWAAWEFMRGHPDWSDASPDLRSDWLGLSAFILARFRDFARAQEFLNRAEDEASRDRAWLHVERAAVLEQAERFDEALASAHKAFDIQPFYRPAIQALAHIHQMRGDDGEAIRVLKEGDAQLEAGLLAAHLGGLYVERGDAASATQWLDRYEALSPILEDEMREWVAARRTDAACIVGDYTAAKGFASGGGNDFYTDLATRLEAEPPADTPASVRVDRGSPLATRWPRGMHPVERLAAFFAPEPGPTFRPGPPSDGLPDSAEREWLRSRGFAVREFTATFDALTELVRRGVPALASFAEGGYSFESVCVGTDPVRRSLWLQDGGEVYTQEVAWDKWPGSKPDSRPRGLAVVPADRAELWDGLELPDEAEWEALTNAQLLAERGDREASRSAAGTVPSEHPLAEWAELAVRRADADPATVLGWADARLARLPDDGTAQTLRLNVLRELGRDADRRKFAAEMLGRKPDEPSVLQHELHLAWVETRPTPAVLAWARFMAQVRPQAPYAFFLLGQLFNDSGDRGRALEGLRFAATLDERDESFADVYYRAAVSARREPEAKRLIDAKLAAVRLKAGAVKTAFGLLRDQGKDDEALALLDARLGQLAGSPEGSELMLFAAEVYADRGDPATADKWLESAATEADPVAFRESAIRACAPLDRPAEALSHAEALLKLRPNLGEAFRAVAKAKLPLEGRRKAWEWLRSEANRRPHLFPLGTALIDETKLALVEGVIDEGEAADQFRALARRFPGSAALSRTLAERLSDAGEFSAALKAASVAELAAPGVPENAAVRATILTASDRPDEARDVCRSALEKSPDAEGALAAWVDSARGDEERKEVLHEIAEILKGHATFGTALFTFREKAAADWEGDDFFRLYDEILDADPKHWQLWSLTVDALTLAGRHEEATELCQEALARFPVQPRLWLNLAEVHHARENSEARVKALQQIQRLSPGVGSTVQELAEALSSAGRRDESVEVLRIASARTPTDAGLGAMRADALWNGGDSEEGLALLERALRLDPAFEFGWNLLDDWAGRSGDPSRPARLAREIASKRPGDASAWLALGRALREDAERRPEAIAALDTAIKLSPKLVDAHDLRAEALAEAGRIEEARSAALPESLSLDPPMRLQARRAWVDAQAGGLPDAIRQMRALVAVEPGFLWGWQQLAEWQVQEGEYDDALAAADKVVEARPDWARGHLLRGQARHRLGEHDAAEADLREALRLAPHWVLPALILIDIALERGDAEAAQSAYAVLDEHAGETAKGLVASRRAQIAALENDREAAAEALAEVCSVEQDSGSSLFVAIDALRKRGWEAEIHTALSNALASETFHPLTLIHWLETPQGTASEPADRLAMVDKTLARHPGFAEGYDLKADTLTRLGRFEEAAEAAKPKFFGEDTPMILVGRSCWVQAGSGDREGAISRMKQLLLANPHYSWGWQQLFGWLQESENWPEALEAADRLVQLRPTDASAWITRGEARRATRDRRGAKADFAKALDVDPSAAQAGHELFELQLEDGDVSAAEKTLDRVREHLPAPLLAACGIDLARAKDDLSGAVELLRQVVSDPDVPGRLVSRAFSRFEDSSHVPALAAMVEQVVMSEEAVHPLAGRLFVETQSMIGADPLAKLNRVAGRGDLGVQAVLAALELYGRKKERRKVARIVADYEAVLASDPFPWAVAGQRLHQVGDYEAVVKWMADWRARFDPALQMAMLFALADSYKRLRDPGHATEVSKAALRLKPDPSIHEHAAWVGLGEALAGRPLEAATMMSLCDGEDATELSQGVVALVKSLLALQTAPAGERSAAFEREVSSATGTLRSLPLDDQRVIYDLAYKAWLSAMCRLKGGLGGFLRRTRERFKPSYTPIEPPPRDYPLALRPAGE